MTSWTWIILAILVVGMLALLWERRRGAGPGATARSKAQLRLDALDTVQAWEPTATRILSASERQAFATLMRALPEYMVLAQVPLSRFLKVPTRHSYSEWFKRVGNLSADLLVCDRASEVLAVVEVRTPRDSERSLQRHERMTRVLTAARVPLFVWMEGDFPTPSSVRDLLVPAAAARHAASVTGGRERLGATPPTAVPLAELDAPDTIVDNLREPPPSTWFDDLDPPAGTALPKG